ncbi:MAG: CRTAC1 family protein [Pirellulaceae bacterium]
MTSIWMGATDLALLDSESVALWQLVDDQWQLFASAKVPEGSERFVVADLFLVDSSHNQRLRKSLVSDDAATGVQQANQHDTFRSFVVSGGDAVSILQINPESAEPNGRLRIPQEPTGLEGIDGVTASTACDVDADGDIDLIFGTRDKGVQIWINRGNMTFYPVAAHSQLPPEDNPAIDFEFVDFDRDLDMDVITLLKDGTVGLLENLLHLQFRWTKWDWANEPGRRTTDIGFADVDGNVSWDLLLKSEGMAEVIFTETSDIGVFKTIGRKSFAAPGSRFKITQLNNDPWPDMVCWNDQGLHVISLRLDGSGAELGNFAVQDSAAINGIAAGDADADGKLDLAIATKNGVRIGRNATQNVGNYLRASFRGIDDNASGRVNHYAIGSVLELRYGPFYRAEVITDPITHFGMGTYDQAITLRAILPNGVTQSVVKPEANQILYEQQTLKGSCPYLYGWDGEKFAFVTDCLWAAPLGLQVAPGEVVPDRPWEYLKVDGRFIKPREGFYELRITEELWELAYFDHLELTAVDHPANVQIFTNEKVGPPSIAEHQIYAFDANSVQPIVAASDSSGKDVTSTLKAIDEDYVQGFQRQYCQGLCQPHWIELDLSSVDGDAERTFLILTGWIFPTDTSLNIQIAQNPDLARVVYPVLEVPDDNGGWRTAIPFIGFPGGKTKTIVVDISGKLNLNDKRARVRTSAQIYWDQAVVAVDPPQASTRQHVLKLATAELGYHGFSSQLPRTSTQPHRYDYQRIDSAPKWPPLLGNLTRYGDVLSLLSDWDDTMVVMGAGDEMRLAFPVPSEPIPDGWVRDFVLHCVGWDKDADLNTLTGQTIDPLPFRSMQAYPPPATQREVADDVRKRNEAQLTRPQRFREFWRRSTVDQPDANMDAAF